MTSDAPAPAPAQPRKRIVTAALYYFALVFGAGLVLGPPRVLWLEPWLGKTLAVALEAPLLILAMWWGARAAPAWAGVRAGAGALLAVGVLALVLQQLADLSVGFGLRGMTLAEQLRYFATPPGYIYAGCLALFAIMPLLRAKRASEGPGEPS